MSYHPVEASSPSILVTCCKSLILILNTVEYAIFSSQASGPSSHFLYHPTSSISILIILVGWLWSSSSQASGPSSYVLVTGTPSSSSCTTYGLTPKELRYLQVLRKNIMMILAWLLGLVEIFEWGMSWKCEVWAHTQGAQILSGL